MAGECPCSRTAGGRGVGSEGLEAGGLVITCPEILPRVFATSPAGICVGSLMGMGTRTGHAPQQPHLKGNTSDQTRQQAMRGLFRNYTFVLRLEFGK